MSKQDIVKRLLAERLITQEEAINLLLDENIGVSYPAPTVLPMARNFGKRTSQAERIEKCACNPANGGSGLCMCSFPDDTYSLTLK